MVTERLEHLKKTLHPEKRLDIIGQCEIVAEALSYGSPYEEDIEGLAIYLEISESKVYQMNYIHHNMIPALKDWFRGTEYQCHTTYDRAKMPPMAQEEFLRGMITLETGVTPNIEPTIITEET